MRISDLSIESFHNLVAGRLSALLCVHCTVASNHLSAPCSIDSGSPFLYSLFLMSFNRISMLASVVFYFAFNFLRSQKPYKLFNAFSFCHD